jgi:hypothetical protein
MFINEDIIKDFNWSSNASSSAETATAAATKASFGTPPSSLPFGLFLGGGGGNRGQVDHLMMIIWTVAVVMYLVLLSPLLFVSIFFWIVAVEFGLHTILLKSTFQYNVDDDLHSISEVDENEQDELLVKKERLTKSATGKVAPEIIRLRAEEAEGYEFTWGPL